MQNCPHPSVSEGYCDACGLRVDTEFGGAAPPSPAAPPPVVSPEEETLCPACGAPWPEGRFCEECGYDRVTGSGPSPSRMSPPLLPGAGGADPPPPRSPPVPLPPPAPEASPSGAEPEPPRWLAVVWADPVYYQSMADEGELDPDALVFPSHYPQRHVPLVGAEILIGRRSESRGIFPDVDLRPTGTHPGDPAVSARHAVLRNRSDGTWAVLDPGSTNGTKVNAMANRIAPGVEVPLAEGDRIYLGAWTVITMQKGRPS